MLKRKLGIAAIAAMSAVAFSQVALAEDFNSWTAYWPKRAESMATSAKPANAATPAKAAVSTASAKDDAFYFKHTGGVPPM